MSETDELKMFCVVPCDLPMPIPKMIVQGGHAFMMAGIQTLQQNPERFWEWFNQAQPKIVLRAKNRAALERARAECEAAGISCYLVVDAGRTVFPEPTATYLGIGPCLRSELPKFVQKFQLLDANHIPEYRP